jgi:YebC/PmpR family DNA-binding regulatory protein
MSGHSKWSSIKHKKGKEDARRGKIFTKLIRELTVAAKSGGADPDNNPRLRQAILTAKQSSMPKDNIDRAIKKGVGGAEGANYEEIMFEGYGPAGVALLVQVLTDNRNRTVAEIRHLLDRHNGKMGETGCVSWMFEKRGNITIDKAVVDENTLMEVALEAGAEDVRDGFDFWEVFTSQNDYEQVRAAIEAKGIAMLTSEIAMIPQTTIDLAGKDAEQMVKLLDVLEDQDDVQHVYANFDISEKEMERLTAS